MPLLGQQRLELLLVDEVAADLVLQVGLPVELDGARDVAAVVGGGVLVDLDEDDAVVVEVLLDPVGGDERGFAAHGFLLFLAGLVPAVLCRSVGFGRGQAGRSRSLARRRYISQPRQKPKAALRNAAASAIPAATAPTTARRRRTRRSATAANAEPDGLGEARRAASSSLGRRRRGGDGRRSGTPRRTACAPARAARPRRRRRSWTASSPTVSGARRQDAARRRAAPVVSAAEKRWPRGSTTGVVDGSRGAAEAGSTRRGRGVGHEGQSPGRGADVRRGCWAGQERGHSDERTRQLSTARRRVSMVETPLESRGRADTAESRVSPFGLPVRHADAVTRIRGPTAPLAP